MLPFMVVAIFGVIIGISFRILKIKPSFYHYIIIGACSAFIMNIVRSMVP